MIEEYRPHIEGKPYQKDFEDYVKYIEDFPGLNNLSLNMGFHTQNIGLSLAIPRDKIVVDVGCGFGFQHILYEKHIKWIGIQHFWPLNTPQGTPTIKIFTDNARIIIGKLKDVWQELGITEKNKHNYFGVANHSLWLKNMPDNENEDIKIFKELFPINYWVTDDETQMIKY